MYKIECNEGPLRLVRSLEQVSKIHSNVMHCQVLLSFHRRPCLILLQYVKYIVGQVPGI